MMAELKFYSSGIMEGNACLSSLVLDHSVIIVGWGVLNGIEYWVIKNSWGTGWGENGFGKMLIKDDGIGVCGIHLYGVYTNFI